MKLRTKLILGLGILLLATIIVIYTVPTFFIRKEIRAAANEIHGLLLADEQQLIHSQQIWLNNLLQHRRQSNNGFLYLLYEKPLLSTPLLFTDESSDYDVWVALSRAAGYDLSIGFIQAHSPQRQKTAVVMPHAAQLYPTRIAQSDGTLVLALLESKQEKNQYLALPLPRLLQHEENYTLYLLIDRQASTEEQGAFQNELNQWAEGRLAEAILSEPVTYGVEWMVKVGMIRALTPFYALALTERKNMPQGLARIDKQGNGLAILSQEAYSTQPLYNDVGFYQTHQPKGQGVPLASDSAIVTVAKGNYAYLANILFINGTYLTLGTPLGLLTQQLALSSNKAILLNVNHNFWLGYDSHGMKMEQKTIDKFTPENQLVEKTGQFQVDGATYYYNQVLTLEQGHLIFYDLRTREEEKGIVGTLIALENTLSKRISLQLFLITVGTVLVFLAFILQFGFSVIHPIMKLAEATQYVVTGRYGEIVLPYMGQREDEVATLTHSFADMVAGLQEREKIRGVLDKVVSKDVADEILKTQIHLGGEDRIVTMLFSDIRGFSHLTAATPPQSTIAMLNACMTKVSRVIEGEGGVIDKYVGDEVMAIYGAPTTHPDHALRAVSSGILIIETLKLWNQQRLAAQEPAIEMGIGIHTGLVVAGNMGSEDRLNYTVLGANVNLAQRLCEVAKPNQLLISAATLAEPKVAASFYVKPLKPLIVKGFEEVMEIYEIIGFKWDEERTE